MCGMCLTMCSQQEEADRTIFVGNLDSKVKEEILFELFLQAGPLSKVRICKDKEGNSKSFGFVCFKHIDSVSYAIALLNEIRLFGRPIKLQYTMGYEVEPFEASQPAGIFSSNGLEENEGGGDVIECADNSSSHWTKGSNLGMKNITNKEPSLISYDLPSGNFIFPTPTGMTDAHSLFPPPFFFQGMVKTFDQQFYSVSQYSSLQTVPEQAGHWPMIPYANAVQCFLAGNQNQRNNAFQPVGGWDCKRKRQLQVSESESDSSMQKKLCTHTTEHSRKYRKHN